MNDHTYPVRLSSEELERWHEAAKLDRRSLAGFIRSAVEREIERQQATLQAIRENLERRQS